MHCHYRRLTLMLAAALLNSANASNACELPTTLNHTVTAIKDTRTLKLDDGSDLRLAVLLSPTPYDSPAAPNNWPPEKSALAALKDLASNKNIAISLERTARDRYGRLLGHALLTSGPNTGENSINKRWLQARLVRAGLARVNLTPEISANCARRLLALEAAADAERKGLWDNAAYRPKRAEDVQVLRRYRSTFQIVEGVVARVSIRKSAIYLNFGKDWKRDFTAKLSRATLRRANIRSSDLKALHRHPVRIRGWLEQRNGPLITIWRLEQIERLTLTSTGETRRQRPPNLLSDLQPSQPRKTPRYR